MQEYPNNIIGPLLVTKVALHLNRNRRNDEVGLVFNVVERISGGSST